MKNLEQLSQLRSLNHEFDQLTTEISDIMTSRVQLFFLKIDQFEMVKSEEIEDKLKAIDKRLEEVRTEIDALLST